MSIKIMYLPLFIVPSFPQITYFTKEDNLEWDIRPNLRSVIQVSIGSMDVLFVPGKLLLYAFKWFTYSKFSAINRYEMVGVFISKWFVYRYHKYATPMCH